LPTTSLCSQLPYLDDVRAQSALVATLYFAVVIDLGLGVHCKK